MMCSNTITCEKSSSAHVWLLSRLSLWRVKPFYSNDDCCQEGCCLEEREREREVGGSVRAPPPHSLSLPLSLLSLWLVYPPVSTSYETNLLTARSSCEQTFFSSSPPSPSIIPPTTTSSPFRSYVQKACYYLVLIDAAPGRQNQLLIIARSIRQLLYRSACPPLPWCWEIRRHTL